jgi:hypothetical protein
MVWFRNQRVERDFFSHLPGGRRRRRRGRRRRRRGPQVTGPIFG